MFLSPLESFKVFHFLSLDSYYFDFSISNSFFYISLIFMFILFIFSKNFVMVLNFSNSLFDFSSFVFYSIFDHFSSFFYQISLNHKNIFSFIPYIITLFFFLLFANLLGIIPYSFTLTGQFIITFFFSFSNIFGITLIGFIFHKFIFFSLFIPKGIHVSLVPFISFIEIISYLSRIISLSVRLSANMIAGHVILTILSSVGLVIVPLLLFIFLLEILVAFIQAYVFAVLISIYLRDVIFLH